MFLEEGERLRDSVLRDSKIVVMEAAYGLVFTVGHGYLQDYRVCSDAHPGDWIQPIDQATGQPQLEKSGFR